MKIVGHFALLLSVAVGCAGANALDSEGRAQDPGSSHDPGASPVADMQNDGGTAEFHYSHKNKGKSKLQRQKSRMLHSIF